MKTSQIMSGSCWLPLMKPITGRAVESFMSTDNAGPDLEVELFFLAPAA